jgi:hypothetical protein
LGEEMPWISKSRLRCLHRRIEMAEKRSDYMHRRAQKVEGDMIKMAKAFGLLTKHINPSRTFEYK